MNILNPLTDKHEHISSVLFALASQGGCDGEPYDQMQVAGEYILKLEAIITEAYRLIDEG